MTRTSPTLVEHAYRPGVVTAGFYDRLTQVARRMRDHDVGALVVYDDGTPVGIITEQDLVQAVADEAPLARTIAADYMMPNLVTVQPDMDLAAASRLMRDGHLRHLPVVTGGEVVGMFSVRDLVGAWAP